MATRPAVSLTAEEHASLQRVRMAVQAVATSSSCGVVTSAPALADALAARCGLFVTVRQGLSTDFYNMRHAFLLVQLCAGQGPVIVVDPSFKDRFVYSMLPPQTTYGACVAALPKLFVGTLATITSLVNLVSSALQKEAAARGHELPPWRSPRALMTNWLPARFSDSVHAPPSCGLHPVLLNSTHGHCQQPGATAAAAASSACASSSAASARCAAHGDDRDGRQMGPNTVVRGFAAVAPERAASAAAPVAIPAANGRPLVLNLLPTTASCNATASECCSVNSSLCSSPASSCGSPGRSRISTAAASSSQEVMASGDGATTAKASGVDGGGRHRSDAAGAAGARALAIALVMSCDEEERRHQCGKSSHSHSHSHTHRHHHHHQQQQQLQLLQRQCSQQLPSRKRVSLLTRSLSVAAASAQAAAAAARSLSAAATAPVAPRPISIFAAAAAATAASSRGGEGHGAACIAHVEEAQQRGSSKAMAALRREGTSTEASAAGRCSSATRQAPQEPAPAQAAAGAGGAAAAAFARCAAAASLPMRHCVSSTNLTSLKQLPSRSGVWEDAPAQPLPCRRHPALMPAAEANVPLPAPPTAAPAAPKQAVQSGVVPGTRRCFAPRAPAATAAVPVVDRVAAAAPAVRCC